MNRKVFIKNISLAAGTLILRPNLYANFNDYKLPKNLKYVVASKVTYPTLNLPDKKVIHKGWKAFPVPAVANDATKVTLHFPAIKSKDAPVWLRITAALFFDEQYNIGVHLAESGVLIGTFDIRYAHIFQPFQIPIDAKYNAAISEEGITLQMEKGKKDAWFFLPDAERMNSKGLQPHLLVGTTKDVATALEKNILSENAIACFGWIGGCVNDALLEMSRKGNPAALTALKKQLLVYLNNDSGIYFENPGNEPLNGTFNSIEDFLPFAAIVDLFPQHKSIDLALAFLQSKEKADGLILSGNEVTTEGCYTVAYPLAAIAVNRNNRNLAEKALAQLRHRAQHLNDGAAIYQRATLEGKQRFRNWGRGVVWYLLGTVKTLGLLQKAGLNKPEDLAAIENDFRKAVEMVTKWQDSDGFYYAFIDRKETGIDVSATAGIAAAMGWGVQFGYLDNNLLPNLKQTQQNLLQYVTPDGFVTGITQINRGGEALQESGYRVMTQFGMGLMLQLAMALRT